jgi:hypothetical protein
MCHVRIRLRTKTRLLGSDNIGPRMDRVANLLDFVVIAGICTWNIIGQRFWSSELMVG